MTFGGFVGFDVGLAEPRLFGLELDEPACLLIPDGTVGRRDDCLPGGVWSLRLVPGLMAMVAESLALSFVAWTAGSCGVQASGCFESRFLSVGVVCGCWSASGADNVFE